MTSSEKATLITKKAYNYKTNLGIIEERIGGLCPHAQFLDGYKDNIKKYQKIIPCGKEWCPVCGKKGSLLHRQRFARGIERILGSKVLGYFVITFPVEIRLVFLDRVMLSDFTIFVNKLLQSYKWYIGSVARWHWAGDERQGIWHPHLNILVNQTRKGINKKDLMEIKEAVLEWVCQNVDYKVKNVVLDYSYTNKYWQKMKEWRYVVRPTMLLLGNKIYELGVIDKLYRYMNTRWYGKWEKMVWVNKAISVLSDEDIKWIYRGQIGKEDMNGDCVKLEDILEGVYIGYGIFLIS